MQLFPIGKVYDFMGARRFWGLISTFMFVSSIVGLVVPGPVMGTDFRGGTEVELAFESAVTDEQIRSAAQERRLFVTRCDSGARRSAQAPLSDSGARSIDD